MGNEADGFAFLREADGRYAAQVFGIEQDAALMEYLPGPSLGDLSRDQDDKQAAAHLVAVANGLHALNPKGGRQVQTVANWLDALFEIQFAPNCSSKGRTVIQKAKRLAQELVSTPEDICFLHGDLHHDNVRKAARGYCAFDAKGVVGERAYELANAFRNPKAAAPLVRDPKRIRFLRELWSREFVVPPLRLMQWVCVKTALSICWRSGPVLSDDPEFDLLEIFFGVLDETL